MQANQKCLGAYLTWTPSAKKALKYQTYIGKLAGFISTMDALTSIDPKLGVVIFAVASPLKDTVNRISDLVDDGKPNQSFKS